jgi:hypothetical protein
VDDGRRYHRPEDEYQGQGGLLLGEGVQTAKSVQIGKVRGTKLGTKMSIWSRPGRPSVATPRKSHYRVKTQSVGPVSTELVGPDYVGMARFGRRMKKLPP